MKIEDFFPGPPLEIIQTVRIEKSKSNRGGNGFLIVATLAILVVGFMVIHHMNKEDEL